MWRSAESDTSAQLGRVEARTDVDVALQGTMITRILAPDFAVALPVLATDSGISGVELRPHVVAFDFHKVGIQWRAR